METLEQVKKSLVGERPQTFEDCVSWARYLFEENNCNTIKQLLYNFPPDQVRKYIQKLIKMFII